MEITINGRAHLCSGIRLEGDISSFRLYGGGDPEWIELARVANIFPVPVEDYELKAYKIALFRHRSWPESQVLTLREGLRRIGVLFSLQALGSDQSVLLEDRHHTSYGFIALQKLCLGEQITGLRSAEISTLETIGITELFPEDTIVVVFDESSVGGVVGREYVLERLPSFAKFGFFMLGDGTVSRQGSVFNAGGVAIGSSQKNLPIRGFSAVLPSSSRSFLQSVFLTVTPHERNAVFRFFLAYQVLESLMQDLYARIIGEFAEKVVGENSFRIKELIDSFQVAIREKPRLKEIISVNQRANDEARELMIACNSLLQATGIASEPNAESALYSVRNLLFHRYSDAQLHVAEMEGVAEALFIMVCELVMCYQHPAAKLESRQ